jgi:hypothetical protein
MEIKQTKYPCSARDKNTRVSNCQGTSLYIICIIGHLKIKNHIEVMDSTINERENSGTQEVEKNKMHNYTYSA